VAHVKLYLDICCLKRSFDSQQQALVRLEAEAVATILSLPPERVTLVRTPAQTLENSLNPVRWRREAVAAWLDAVPVVALDDCELERRTAELIALGFKSFDALHVASAEACADALITVDERFRKKAERLDPPLRVRVTSPLVLAQEVLEWKT
jgi:predicted nucleic acid-binding protein